MRVACTPLIWIVSYNRIVEAKVMLGLILASEHLERIIDRGPSAQEDGTLCFLGTHSDFARFVLFIDFSQFSKADCDYATIHVASGLLPCVF